MNYSKEKWIAAIVAVVVIALFFGGMFAYNTQKSNLDLTNLNNNMSDLNQNNDSNSTTSPSITGGSHTTADGLVIQDEVVGTGAAAKTGNTVTVNYIGTLQDGTKFDSSYDHGQPFSFNLGAGEVIPGWDEGIVGMKPGGKRKLIIPPSLAYGAEGAGGAIPPNATLTFEVELVSIK